MFQTDIKNISLVISSYIKEGKKVFSTSSFQSQSLVLLHIISQTDKNIPVYFINTGYHFPETLEYRDFLMKQLGLNVISISSPVPRHLQKDASGRLLFASDPDRCCYFNKVLPMEKIVAEHDVWINGVRADQTNNRKNLETIEKTDQGIIRYHPILEWDRKKVEKYIKYYDLPKHPLEFKGYPSIGCEPCTRKIDVNDLVSGRAGRWDGLNKTECGIHTELIGKEKS